MTFLLIFLQAVTSATPTVEPQNTGKIYVVVAVIAILFIGITTYLVLLDRNIKKLENKN